MDTIFTINSRDLRILSSERAVDIFRELLWAEATALGVGKHLINVPTAITVSDGGIDAEVRDVVVSGGQGIIRPGLTSYQIKTGNYSLKKHSNIQKILFTPRSIRAKSYELEPKVKACLDKNGTLIIVLFGWDDPDRHDEFVDQFKIELKTFDPKYEDAKLEIFLPNQLMGFFKPFPSLALKVKGLEDTIFQTHQSWSENEDMQGSFEEGGVQYKNIVSLQEMLRKGDTAVHIHVMGEPGIGKTRYVLEATHAEDLSPLVIYCNADTFRDRSLMNELLRVDNQASAILILDECDDESRVYIWNKLKRRGPRIKLVTIYGDFTSFSGDTITLEISPLQKDQISRIIQSYDIVEDQADRWSDLCGGSPRVAHVIGWNLKNNPDDLLRPLDTFPLWDRYITGGDRRDSEEVRQRRLVLRYLALFKRFGYESSLAVEVKAIAELIEQADPHIPRARFNEIIETLRKRKILQGNYTLYITPKALHIKLWIDWWEIYGVSFVLDTFSASLPRALLEWFYEMFVYAANSQAATIIVNKLLGEDGPFKDDTRLETELGSHFFFALAQASPEAALACLKRTVGTWSKERLLNFITGRRKVIWALERIAMWRPLFADAARLLLALGEAENESWSNNASGVFAELFSLGPGEVAPTQASPQERLPVLKEALTSSSVEQRRIAIHACDKALESQYFFRDVGAEYQGLRKVPDLWMPATYGELFDAYRQIWQLLYTQLNVLSEEQQLIISLLLHRAQGLARYEALADMVINTLGEMAQKPFIDSKQIFATIVRILHYDGQKMPERLRLRWEQLRETLIGSDFSSRMKRYVGMDLLEDRFDEQGNQVDQVQTHIEELARIAIENSHLLEPELSWLITNEAQNGYRFGYELAKRDTQFSLLPTLLEAQKHAQKSPSVFFLSGYLRILFEKERSRWEDLADLLAKDMVLRAWLTELTLRTGLTDRGAMRLLKLAEENVIDIAQLRFFSAGRSIQLLTEDIFQRWIQFLQDYPHPYALPIAIDLYAVYYVDKESKQRLPKQLTLTLLTHEAWIKPGQDVQFDIMDYYHWTEVGKTFVQTYPETSMALANWILEYFGAVGTILDRFSETTSVLSSVMERSPEKLWLTIKKYLGPPLDSHAYYIRRWLRGEDGPIGVQVKGVLSYVPLQLIWDWVDEDVEQRAWYLASFVPKSLFRKEEHFCLAREVLIRYGERKDVREAFSANYFTGSWMGPESLHYESIKQKLLDFKAEEENENVKSWINEYVAELDEHIQRARIQEERDAF